MKTLQIVSTYLNEHAQELATNVVKDITEKVGGTPSQTEHEGYVTLYTTFVSLLGEALKEESKSLPDAFSTLSEKIGEKHAATKQTMSSALQYYPVVRASLMEHIGIAIADRGISSHEICKVMQQLNWMIDASILVSIQAFEKATKKLLTQQEKTLSENRDTIKSLSAPIVLIQDDIAVLPIIGMIDHQRVEYILADALPRITELSLRCLIIDFSGIETIDVEVAEHLFKLYDILYLLGIEVAFTGIRSDLAVKAIQGGVDFSAVRTYAHVKQAVEAL